MQFSWHFLRKWFKNLWIRGCENLIRVRNIISPCMNFFSHISLFGTNPFHIDKNAHTKKKQHQLCHVNSSTWQQTTKKNCFFLFLSIFHNALRHNRHKKSLIFLTWFDKIDDADDAYQNDSILSINHNYCTRHISNVFHKLAVAYMYHTLFHHV